MSKKYCLVRFVDDNILYVVSTNKITPIEDNLVWAPYKGMGYYEATPMEYNDSRTLLENKKKEQGNKKFGIIPQVALVDVLAQKSYRDDDMQSVNENNNSLDVRQNATETTENEESDNQDEDDDSVVDPDFEPGLSDVEQTRNETIDNEESENQNGVDNDSIMDADFKPRLSDVEQTRNETTENEKSRNPNEVDNDSVMDADFEPRISEVARTRNENYQIVAPIYLPTPDMDYKKLIVFKSNNRTKSKVHFCKYCMKLQTKFARHLENKHKNEESVAEFLRLPKKDISRSQLIQKIRVEGDFLYNTQNKYNLEGNLIVVRCPTSKQRTADQFRPCGNCGGMYSKMSLTAHYRKCQKNRIKGAKDVFLMSKQKSMFISSKASDILRSSVLPSLCDDRVTKTIISDEVIILFGNRLCQKYRSHHLYKMIRAKLRCVATFLITLREISGIPKIKLEEIFDPLHYENCISSINKMCGLNQETGRYKSPATAFAIGSHLKKIAFYMISEYIKQKNKTRQEEVKDFLLLLQEGLAHDINKTVQENQLERNRKKKNILPSSQDIQHLRIFLDNRRSIFIKKLNDKFTFQAWKELLSVTLTSLQFFNRRRAGEIERVAISDFLNYERLEDNDEMLGHLDSDEKKKVNNYVRFLIRGKLMRGVPVMVNKDNFIALKLLLKFRNEAGVSSDNTYLFGLPGNSHSHLSASKLMNQYSKLCGAEKPNTLRGTQLRKHIATKCATMDLGKTELKDIADYLGHNEKIHLDHYRLPNVAKDIVRMSNILEKAQGDGDGNLSQDSYPEMCTETIDSEGNLEMSNDDYRDISNESKDSQKLDEINNNSRDISNKSTVSITGRNSRKLSWTKEEKKKVDEEFHLYIDTCEMPSVGECNIFIERESLNRSIGQVRGYISNQIKKQKAKVLSTSKQKDLKKVKRTRWTSPEKKEAFRIFGKELRTNTLPSTAFCQEILEHNSVFHKRTPEMLRAFINNTNKKKKNTG
ncbi:uncharacterized protein isoform X2 [Leptinotarsa decemlineata]